MPAWASLPLDKAFLGLAYLPAAYFLPLVFLPRWSLTKKFGKSQLPFLVLGAVFVYSLAVCAFLNADLVSMAKNFVTGQATLAQWQTFLSADAALGAKSLFVFAAFRISDMFIGRHIYLDSIKGKTFALHSMLATLFVNGVVGYMLHVLTKYLTGRSASGIAEAVDEDDPLPYEY